MMAPALPANYSMKPQQTCNRRHGAPGLRRPHYTATAGDLPQDDPMQWMSWPTKPRRTGLRLLGFGEGRPRLGVSLLTGRTTAAGHRLTGKRE